MLDGGGVVGWVGGSGVVWMWEAREVERGGVVPAWLALNSATFEAE